MRLREFKKSKSKFEKHNGREKAKYSVPISQELLRLMHSYPFKTGLTGSTQDDLNKVLAWLYRKENKNDQNDQVQDAKINAQDQKISNLIDQIEQLKQELQLRSSPPEPAPPVNAPAKSQGPTDASI